MPSATARMLWLQRLNSRFVNHSAIGSVTRSAAAPASTGACSQRSKAIVTAATIAAVSVTTIAMRPASERWARGFAAIRSLSCQISPRLLLARDPAVELRVQRRERQHPVLEQDLVKGLHVELRPERVFRAPAHLGPLDSAERVGEHEARKAADQR